MYNVAVVSKKYWEVLSNTQTNEVSLDGPSVVQIGMDTDKIEKFERIGNDLVITLLNGNSITIEKFFNNRDTADNSVVFQNSDGDLYLLGYNHEAGVTKFVEYTVIDSIQPLLYLDGESAVGGILPWLFPLLAGGAVAAYTDYEDDDDSDLVETTEPSTHNLEVGVDIDNSVISGNTTPNSTVKVYDEAGELLTETVAGEDGTFEVELDQPLEDGEQVNIIAESEDGETAEASVEGYVEPPVVTAVVEIETDGDSVDVSFTDTPYGADNEPLTAEQILNMLSVYAIGEDGQPDTSSTVGQLTLSSADSANAYTFDIELDEGVNDFAIGFNDDFYDQDGRTGEDKTNIYLGDSALTASQDVEETDSSIAKIAINDFDDSEIIGNDVEFDLVEVVQAPSSESYADSVSVEAPYDAVKDLLDTNSNIIG